MSLPIIPEFPTMSSSDDEVSVVKSNLSKGRTQSNHPFPRWVSPKRKNTTRSLLRKERRRGVSPKRKNTTRSLLRKERRRGALICNRVFCFLLLLHPKGRRRMNLLLRSPTEKGAEAGSPSNSMKQLELTERISFDVILLDRSCTADNCGTVDENHFTHCVVRIVDNAGPILVSFDHVHGFTVDREKIVFLDERRGKRMVYAPNLGFAGCVFGTREQVAVTRSEILSYLQEQCQKVKHTLTPPTNCFYPVLLLRDHPKYIPNVDSFSNRWLTCVGPAFPYNRQILVYTEFQTKSAVAPIIKAGSWFEVSYSKPRPAYNGPVMVVAVLRVSLVWLAHTLIAHSQSYSAFTFFFFSFLFSVDSKRMGDNSTKRWVHGQWYFWVVPIRWRFISSHHIVCCKLWRWNHPILEHPAGITLQ